MDKRMFENSVTYDSLRFSIQIMLPVFVGEISVFSRLHSDFLMVHML